MIEVEERPWGAWKVVHEEPRHTVKVLTVNPGCMLSLQSHLLRTEYWVPLETGLMAYTTSNEYGQHGRLLKARETFTVGCNQIHRLINPTDRAISVVEIIHGDYDEADIRRYHDSYGRV